MKKFILSFFLFVIMLPIFAQNHIDLLSEINGEYPYSQFGYNVVSLDFNADGYDDLAVEANRWQYDPDTLYTGKFYFYFGKEHCFGDSADMTISGYRTPDSSYAINKLVSIGDINNDGYDDIGYESFKNNSILCLNFLFGNSVKDSIPDKIFRFSTSDFIPSYLRRLGDLNGDGYDDVGFMMEKNNNDETTYCYIIYGGEDELSLTKFKTLCYPDSNYSYGAVKFRGIGDVNSDGYDDIQISSSLHITILYNHDMIFFGGAEMDTIPDFEHTDNEIAPIDSHGLKLGDFNGDGRDDFILYYSSFAHKKSAL